MCRPGSHLGDRGLSAGHLGLTAQTSFVSDCQTTSRAALLPPRAIHESAVLPVRQQPQLDS